MTNFIAGLPSFGATASGSILDLIPVPAADTGYEVVDGRVQLTSAYAFSVTVADAIAVPSGWTLANTAKLTSMSHNVTANSCRMVHAAVAGDWAAQTAFRKQRNFRIPVGTGMRFWTRLQTTLAPSTSAGIGVVFASGPNGIRAVLYDTAGTVTIYCGNPNGSNLHTLSAGEVTAGTLLLLDIFHDPSGLYTVIVRFSHTLTSPPAESDLTTLVTYAASTLGEAVGVALTIGSAGSAATADFLAFGHDTATIQSPAAEWMATQYLTTSPRQYVGVVDISTRTLDLAALRLSMEQSENLGENETAVIEWSVLKMTAATEPDPGDWVTWSRSWAVTVDVVAGTNLHLAYRVVSDGNTRGSVDVSKLVVVSVP